VDDYRTVFEVFYDANGYLLMSLGYFAVGVAVSLGVIFWFKRVREPARGRTRAVVICVLWLAMSTLFVGLTLGRTWTYTRALQNGRCDVVEGTVEVLQRQPESWHAGGDLVRVGGHKFEVDYFDATPAYNRTIAHGGVLWQGNRVRLHHLDSHILKVEVPNHPGR
jgi:hypothetical protein